MMLRDARVHAQVLWRTMPSGRVEAGSAPIAAFSSRGRPDARNEVRDLLDQVPGQGETNVVGTRTAAVGIGAAMAEDLPPDMVMLGWLDRERHSVPPNGSWAAIGGHHAVLRLHGGGIQAVRDVAGTRPLHARTGRLGIAYCSDQRALLDWGGPAGWDEEAVRRILAADWRRSWQSMRAGFHRVPPGTMEHVTDGVLRSRQRYWDPLKVRGRYWINRVEAQERFGRAFEESVNRCADEDEHVGILLSGGVDSSSIAAMCRKKALPGQTIHAYSVLLPYEESDEGNHAQEVAEHLGLKHTIIGLDDLSVRRTWETVAKRMAEPPLITNLALQEACYRAAEADGVKRVLDGIPGDLVAGQGKSSTIDALLHLDFRAALDQLNVADLGWPRALWRRIGVPALRFVRRDGRKLGRVGLTEARTWRSGFRFRWAARGFEESYLVADQCGVATGHPFSEFGLMDVALRFNSVRFHFDGRVNRTLLRKAVSEALPPDVVRRTSKGRYHDFVSDADPIEDNHADHIDGALPAIMQWWHASKRLYIESGV